MAPSPQRSDLIPRIALALLAAAVVAVLAIELHWARVEAAGRALATGHRIAAYSMALRDFQRVDAHQPGTQALLDEAELYLFLGAGREAVRVLGQAVSVEPQNALAWRLLGEAAARSDPALSARARMEFLRLDPPVGRR